MSAALAVYWPSHFFLWCLLYCYDLVPSRPLTLGYSGCPTVRKIRWTSAVCLKPFSFGTLRFLPFKWYCLPVLLLLERWPTCLCILTGVFWREGLNPRDWELFSSEVSLRVMRTQPLTVLQLRLLTISWGWDRCFQTLFSSQRWKFLALGQAVSVSPCCGSPASIIQALLSAFPAAANSLSLSLSKYFLGKAEFCERKDWGWGRWTWHLAHLECSHCELRTLAVVTYMID